MKKENFCFYIKVRTVLNIPPRTIHKELHLAHDDQTSSLKTVERWSKWFREGRDRDREA